MTHHRFALLVAFSLALAAALPAAEFQVPLTIEEPAGVARTAAPACGGIPLPAGQFRSDQEFAVFDGDKEVPAQTLPLVVDEKGFVRWLLVDVQVDLPTKGSKTLTLKAVKPGVSPAKAVKVAANADAVTIDTGAAVITISKSKPFGLFDSVTVGGKPVVTGGAVSYTDGFDGKKYVADKPTSVQVEYAGPMRTTVCIKGRFAGDEQSKLLYIARVTAWAGRSDVSLKYSLANSNEERYQYRQIKDSSIELKLAAAAGGATVGLAKPFDATGASVAVEQGLRKGVAGSSKVIVDGKDAWTNAAPAPAAGAKPAPVESPDGWLVAKANPVGAIDLYFSDNPARRLAVNNDALVLGGIIERYKGDVTDPLEAKCGDLLGQKVKDPKTDEEKAKNKDLDKQIGDLRKQVNALGLPYGAKSRWLFDCSHLTSQYVIDFAAAADKMADAAKQARQQLHVLAPPAWYFEGTEALAVGKFGTQADELKCYDAWGWKYDPKQVPVAPQLNLGRWVAGEDNHYETEDDTTDALLLMYLRTGKRAFFDTCEHWTNYNLDLAGWRTDGWRYKDGGVWWTSGGPLGSSPQRKADPVTSMFNGAPAPWTTGMKTKTLTFNWGEAQDLAFMANSKMCYCHNWGEGAAEWFCITGDRDALEAAIDNVEQNYDTQKRAFRKTPGKASGYSRDFTRACYLTNATRLIAPADSFVIEASDYLAACFLQRPDKEPRGFLNAPHQGALAMAEVKKRVGDRGVEEMTKLGVTLDEKTGELSNPKTGVKWHPLLDPQTWMFPPLSRAMETYYRITGSEDALDWIIGYGQAVSNVLYQSKHGNLAYHGFLVDFPAKGFAWDGHSWLLPDDSRDGKGVKINGYLAQFYPDVAARAFSYSGDQTCKQRAYDYWFAGSHRGYYTEAMQNVGSVGAWPNVYGVHSEHVCFTGRTFYEFSHPRADSEPPAAVADLAVKVEGEKATVTFTAPADKGGRVARYQVKCADRTIVDYQTFLKAFADNRDAAVCNWWMAANVKGEPAPGKPGEKVSFEVTGLPSGAKCFAIVSFDDSDNRSALSNVAEAK